MSCENEISLQIGKIKTLFKKTENYCSTQNDLNSVIQDLEREDAEFRSIAFEAASMVFATKDILNGKGFPLWTSFQQKTSAHSAQVYAGLGWAIAQQKYSSLPFINSLPALLRFRVADGCGYYDGVLRQRQTVFDKKLPDNLNEDFILAYDQGIGRSIWYKHKTDLEKISETISSFPSDRQFALWRGVGVASAYVGGCDENLLKALFFSAKSHKTQLAVGAILVAGSRVQANAVTKWIELACRVWCDLTAEEAMLLSVKADPSDSIKTNEAYSVWLSQIETEIVSSQLNKKNILK